VEYTFLVQRYFGRCKPTAFCDPLSYFFAIQRAGNLRIDLDHHRSERGLYRVCLSELQPRRVSAMVDNEEPHQRTSEGGMSGINRWAQRARALLEFAGRAILREVHERRYKWTWAHFRERRDDRRRYVELFKRQEDSPALSTSVSFSCSSSLPRFFFSLGLWFSLDGN
jgi:hypothetical protein